MATLEIQGKSIEMETNSYQSHSYMADVSFNTPESEQTEYCKNVEIPLSGSSRSEMTFDQVEEQINEFFKKHFPEMEILNFKGIQIVEKTTIKRRPFDNYDY